MDPKETEGRKKEAAEAARKQLDEGTWPQVTEVFEFWTPRAPHHADGDFARIREAFERAGCANIAAFAEFVRLCERRKGMPVSFNLRMRRRFVPGVAAPAGGNVVPFPSHPDILVGTRGEKEASFEWLENFAGALPGGSPEEMRVFDKIFGEAVDLLKRAEGGATLG